MFCGSANPKIDLRCYLKFDLDSILALSPQAFIRPTWKLQLAFCRWNWEAVGCHWLPLVAIGCHRLLLAWQNLTFLTICLKNAMNFLGIRTGTWLVAAVTWPRKCKHQFCTQHKDNMLVTKKSASESGASLVQFSAWVYTKPGVWLYVNILHNTIDQT